MSYYGFVDYKKLADDLYLENVKLKIKIAELETQLNETENLRISNLRNAEINARNAEYNANYSKYLLTL